ncbi:hypothetical protein CLV45_2757 [Hymenobacter chitinivorans DSM 11115]|uniref:Big-1 domain-containing protein n=2 Tax=Hymenobacter chitinivorans TaxID=89969 RepID=A0A2M9B8Y7_9BACT|nr:hypothetical protein CLV45_2757 [Hymenobacter chitinivorans DSM 11115]
MIKVGGKEVMAIEGDSNKVAFVMPILPEGKVTIDYSGIGINKQLDMTVGTYTPITDPGAVASTFTTELGQIATRFQAHVADPVIQLEPAFITAINQQRQLITDNFPKLSPAEQLEMAYLLKGMMLNDADFALVDHNPDNYRGIKGMIDPEDEWIRARVMFYGSITAGSASFWLATKLASYPTPTPWQWVGISACVATNLACIVIAKSEAKNIGELKALIEEVKTPPSLKFIGGKLQKLNPVGSFRNLNQADKAAFAALFEKVTKLENWYNGLVTITNKVKSIFSSASMDLPPYTNPIKAQSTVKEITLNPAKAVFRNVSDPSIKLAYTLNSAGGFDVTATREAVGLQDRPFTYDIEYTQSGIGRSKTKTVNAVFQPVQPFAVFLEDGNNQSGKPGEALAKPLQVKVIDEDGKRLAFIEVEWSVKLGGGSLSSGKSITNAQGIAQTTWTLKVGASGDQKVEAIVKKADGTPVYGAPTVFTATTGLGALLVAEGTWNLTAYQPAGSDFFQFQDRGNKACYPAGVYDKDRIVSGTYTFSGIDPFIVGTTTRSTVDEMQTYNCATGTYTKTLGSTTVSHGWKIDAQTGKLVFTYQGKEVGWFDATVYENRITFSGRATDVKEGEATSSFYFEIKKK